MEAVKRWWAGHKEALRKRLIHWLGLDKLDTEVRLLQGRWPGDDEMIAVDTSPLREEQTVIVIASRLAGGRVIIRGLHFESMRDLHMEVERLAAQYQVPEKYVIWDAFPGSQKPRRF